MKNLEKHVVELLANGNEKATLQIYQLLSRVTITDNKLDYFITQIVPNIFILINNHQLKKEIVYLSLLPNNSTDLLQRLLDYDLSVTTFDVTNFKFLFEFCCITNRHWLLDIVEKDNSYDNSKFSKCVNSVINILRLIKFSNCAETNLEEIENCLKVVDKENEFSKFYVQNLNSAIDVVKLCQKYPKIRKNVTKDAEVFYSVFNESLLSMFMKFINVQSYDASQAILQMLQKCTNCDTELEQFTAFFIVFNIIRCLKMCKSQDPSEISTIIKEVELKLSSITNLNLQLELLENIFALLFLQEDDDGNLKYMYDKVVSNFYCCEKEVRLLLMFLKSTTDDIKRKNPFDKTLHEFKRFNDFNKLLVDALWKLELIADYEYDKVQRKKIDLYIINYMFASPDSLINLCLKQNDLNKVQQVNKIFNLEKSFTVGEINYNTKLLKLKKQLRKSSKIQMLTKTAPTVNKTTIIQKFFESNPIIGNEQNEEIISQDRTLGFFSTENSIFMNILDLAITQCDTFQECEELLNIAIIYNTVDSTTESSFSKFCKTIIKLFSENKIMKMTSIKEILCTPEFNFELVDEFAKYEEFYSNLATTYDLFTNQLVSSHRGKLNSKHIAHKTFVNLQELTLNYNKEEEQVRYLYRILNYLRSLSKIFYIEGNHSQIISKGSDTSLFEIFEISRSEILEKLIFEKRLDFLDFELLFSKLKMDLVYTLSSIFFPKINLNCYKEDLYLKKKSINLPTDHILTYIQKRNWLLALILSKMYDMPIMPAEVNLIRTKTLTNFLQLPRIHHLKNLFDDNCVIAGLQNKINTKLITLYFEKHVVKTDLVDDSQPIILTSQTSTCSYDTAEEIFEGDLKITNWMHLFDTVDSVPLHQLMHNIEIIRLRDMCLNNLISESFESDYFKYVHLIHDDSIRRECILDNINTWPGDYCIKVIKSELSHFNGIAENHANELKTWLEKITLYERIKLIMGKNSWYQVFLLCKNKPEEVLENLLNTDKINILLKFIDLHEITFDKLEVIDVNYFMMLLDSNATIVQIEKLLYRLSVNHLIYVCFNLLKMLKKLEHLNFIATFIVDSNLDDSNVFKNIQISLKMLSCFSKSEQEKLWNLIADPICILEVLIMNTKFDKLAQVLNKVKPDLENCEFDENRLSVEKIDEILLKYAEKSLEFRVVLYPTSKGKSSESSKLLQSIDSVFFYSSRKNFVMPTEVPKKSDWVPNLEVLECMCCSESTFSMFNRRHHCRRCGRVICGTCSLKRMQVRTYDDVPVRVCLDCYEQSHLGIGSSSIKSEISSKSSDIEYWLLTDDINHNYLVREEFSYEYAPSVSLCLAILKHHTKNENYPRFLLNQCDGMLKLLQPTNSDIAEEIDYLLVIKMLKSLAWAAKMISAECLLQWGTSLADRILSQADLLGLLAERGCLYLIPDCMQSSGRYIDAATLRRLRDKLLEMEQWNLALEVTTKAGLENSGVFAAWGKTCLKAGCLQLAREKFQRCFEKSGFFETSSELSDSYSSIQLPKMFTKALPENRPNKNPPLLNEIVSILESLTCAIHPHLLREIKNKEKLFSSTCSLNSTINQSLPNDSAICILNKLKNLSSVAAGNYSYVSDFNESVRTHKNRANLEPIFYEECVYYLETYGTHLSLLEFYIKHNHLYECLKYILENSMSSDIFIDIYMLCLQNNVVDALQENMSKIDCTLDIWKDFLIAICSYLEKHSKLHCLYQLQQFMGDFVRAAMTCIIFYQEGVRTYSELNSRSHYLKKAQEHLQQELEQEQWVVATVQKPGLDSQESFEAKGITNPSLVMKMDSKNVDKHITTILRQIELTKFLAECESTAYSPNEVLSYAIEDYNPVQVKMPTLFGSLNNRLQLAVLTIVCGHNVEDGFGIGFRIIQDYKLNAGKVYCQAGKLLARMENFAGIAQLVSCIHANGNKDITVTDICDEMLIIAVKTLKKESTIGAELDSLVKLITDRNVKITAYIETKQLKSAFLLAAKHKRVGEIRKILKEAELVNQIHIKALCQQFLLNHAHSKD